MLYPDRISLLTDEKPKASKGPMEKMSELVALSYDLGNRVANPHRLPSILYPLYLFCAAKITLKIATKEALAILGDTQFCRDFRVQRVFPDDGQVRSSIFIPHYSCTASLLTSE